MLTKDICKLTIHLESSVETFKKKEAFIIDDKKFHLSLLSSVITAVSSRLCSSFFKGFILISNLGSNN